MTILYSHPVSQHCRRILALIAEAGIDCDIRHVALEEGEHLSSDYLKINPNHQIPTLEDGNVVIHESNAILRYFCNLHGLKDWYPPDAARRALVDQWLDWTQCRLGPATFFVVFNTVFAGDQRNDELIALGHAQLKDLLPVLEGTLTTRDFVAGNAPTIADLAAASNITHLALAEASPHHPSIVAWIERMTGIRGFAQTLPMAQAA
ncbi:MAG: glutathione S-transferase family protein [Alphaproteobacteria bacterium]